ncbi:hypothetical protein V6N13_012911 [Hibiscus sabdariffa]
MGRVRKRSLHVSGAKLAKGRAISPWLLLSIACSDDDDNNDGPATFVKFVERTAKQQTLALPPMLCRRMGRIGVGRERPLERQRVVWPKTLP